MKEIDCERLIDDAVRALIENHLAWGDSDIEMPGRDTSMGASSMPAWRDAAPWTNGT